MRAKLLLLCISLLSVSQAAAADRFNCATDEVPIKLSIDTAFNDDPAQKLIHFRGIWSLAELALPEDLRNARLDSEALTHSWIDDRDLRLHLYKETAGEKRFASVNLVVAVQKSETEAKTYRGSYTLLEQTAETRKDARASVQHQGKVVCTKG